jgi:ferric-dicitrate binding protein FerR (iron transport regulator)
MKEIDDLNNIPYELMILELEGELSEKERAELQTWKSASLGNERIYDEFIASSDKIALLAIYQKLNTEASWNKFSKLLKTSATKDRHPYILSLKWISAVAASLLLFFGWAFFEFHANLETVATLSNNQKKIILPDSSEIYLNQNTEITYNGSNYPKSRIIVLVKGEAFFKVVHNDKSPFTVMSGEVEIKDIGTSFDVKVSKKLINVIVNTGKVSMENPKGGNKVLLSYNDEGTFNTITKDISVISNKDTNYKSWYDKKFQFINTPLSEVAKKIEDDYGTHILFQDSIIKKRKLTATFHNQSIDEIMHIIAISLKLKVKKINNTFLFDN